MRPDAPVTTLGRFGSGEIHSHPPSSSLTFSLRPRPPCDQRQTKKYYFCVANADYMLNDENSEHFPEVLRERRRFYRETSKDQDFWIVPNPSFLDAMPDVKKKVRLPCVAVVTTDKVWNDFVKLRMDRVYKGAVEGTGVECLKSNELIPKDAFKAPDPSKWTAPYVKYAPGWWEAFYPGNENS
jgi:hypothetical protein